MPKKINDNLGEQANKFRNLLCIIQHILLTKQSKKANVRIRIIKPFFVCTVYTYVKQSKNVINH